MLSCYYMYLWLRRRCLDSFIAAGLSMPYLGKVSGQANDSTMELLYQLGIVQDSGTRLRFVFDAYFFYIDIERE